ncbi:hypothetical protein QT440_22425, partial [Xanthomonas citri pv. citri]
MTIAPGDSRNVAWTFRGNGLSGYPWCLLSGPLTTTQNTRGVLFHGWLVLTQLGKHRGCNE